MAVAAMDCCFALFGLISIVYGSRQALRREAPEWNLRANPASFSFCSAVHLRARSWPSQKHRLLMIKVYDSELMLKVREKKAMHINRLGC